MERCYLCSHKTHVFLNVKNKSILRCTHCALTYTKDISPRSAIVREDSEKFVREYAKEAPYYKKYFDDIVGLILRYKKPQQILDIGCGIGLFLQSAKKFGLKATGVDMSKASVVYARSQGLDVRIGKIEKQFFRPRSFDVITLFQTIEHIEDPLLMLKKIYSLLRKNGVLVMTTPSEESFMAKVLGKNWFGYRNIEHQYFFNKQSLETMQKKVGFKKVKIHTQHGRILTVPWVLIRLFDYYYNQKSPLSWVIAKSRPYWKYLNWITFREPNVNLVSIAVK